MTVFLEKFYFGHLYLIPFHNNAYSNKIHENNGLWLMVYEAVSLVFLEKMLFGPSISDHISYSNKIHGNVVLSSSVYCAFDLSKIIWRTKHFWVLNFE